MLSKSLTCIHALLPRLGSYHSLTAAVAQVGLRRLRASSCPRDPLNSCDSTTIVRQKRPGWHHGSSLRIVAAASTAAKQQPGRQRRQVKEPAPQPGVAAEDAFFAETADSFEELSIAPALVDAMRLAGFTRPSRVQELVIPKILSGSDVVLAAETGSGKTLAYIAPLASILLQRAAAGQQPLTADALSGEAGSSSSSSSSKPKHAQPPRWLGLVLCPNTALCQQVIRQASSLTGPDGQPLLRACQVSSSSPPPFDPPDIVVTTPGALVTLFNDRGYSYGSQWTAEAVCARAACVVVDEADLLFQGGYAKDLIRLLDAFKAGERRLIEAQVMSELNMTKDTFARLPRHIKAACWEGGAPAMMKAGYKPRRNTEQQQQQDEQESAQSPSAAADVQQQQQQEQQQQEGFTVSEAASTSSSSGDSSSSSSNSEKGGAKKYGPYFQRQHLFVAATMPALTKGDVGTELQKRFKAAVWVSGELLHQVQPHVDHSWINLSSREADADSALLQAITADPDYQQQRARVLVFTRNTASADRVSQMLSEHGVDNLLYHKNVPVPDQAAALSAMAAPLPGKNLVMVSTDAAARGIDLPDITHVIQADFAANAIEFLHRVGRTARAGRSGKVTSLYGRSDTVLADAVRKYIKEGLPIEDCFSRNRSFSRKVKRYGQFVPRGVEGPQG